MKICKIEDCERKHKAHGYCNLHYRRIKTTGMASRPRDGNKCDVSGCERDCTRNLYCDKHYYRFKKYGDPLIVEERFQKKDYTIHELFLKSFSINVNTDCWDWVGNKNAYGYGRLNYASKHFAAHRYSYEFYNNKLEDGLFICHHCDNPACVNPAHLFAGTPQDNVNDMVAKGRHIGCRKLNEKDVREIRRLLKTSLTQPEIAKLFKVSRGAISNIAYWQTWRNVK